MSGHWRAHNLIESTNGITLEERHKNQFKMNLGRNLKGHCIYNNLIIHTSQFQFVQNK